ncbi:MAG: helix-turn-helix transcriptional regulator [Proteobacteria bacterium]|nr:helix-turn-helix transcriptional regulator [Pseudomonadota bacterium]
MSDSISDVTIAKHDVQSADCRKISQVLARIGEKWSVLIIMMLSGGTRRFSDLRRDVDGISQRMLTLCLRGLERDGLVKRTVFPVVPPRVDYELTALGRSLCEPVVALGTWARDHTAEIDAARAAFDQRANLDGRRPDDD